MDIGADKFAAPANRFESKFQQTTPATNVPKSIAGLEMDEQLQIRHELQTRALQGPQ